MIYRLKIQFLKFQNQIQIYGLPKHNRQTKQELILFQWKCLFVKQTITRSKRKTPAQIGASVLFFLLKLTELFNMLLILPHTTLSAEKLS